MRVGFLIGRIVLGLYYLVTGIMDIVNFKMLSGYAASVLARVESRRLQW